LDIRLLSSWLILCLIVGLNSSFAQVDTVVIREYSNAWLSLDRSNRVFQSFDGDDINVGGFYLPREEIQDNLLKVCGGEFHLWSGGALVKQQEGGCSYFGIDQLNFPDDREAIFISFSSSEMDGISVELIALTASTRKVNPILDKDQGVGQVWIWLLLIFLGLMALAKATNQDLLKEIFQLRNFNSNQKLELENPLGRISTILLILIISVVISANGAFRQQFNEPFILVFFIVGFLFCKAVLIFLLSRSFNFGKVASLQFRSYVELQSAVLTVLFLFYSTLVWSLTSVSWMSSWIIYSVFASGVIHFAWLFFFLQNRLGLRKLHLISYLCASEIFPTFILAKWLF